MSITLRTIELPCFGIKITLATDSEDGETSGKIESELHQDPQESFEYNAAIDAIESLILAHACEGIDVESPAYLCGIETTLDAIGNQY